MGHGIIRGLIEIRLNQINIRFVDRNQPGAVIAPQTEQATELPFCVLDLTASIENHPSKTFELGAGLVPVLLWFAANCYASIDEAVIEVSLAQSFFIGIQVVIGSKKVPVRHLH